MIEAPRANLTLEVEVNESNEAILDRLFALDLPVTIHLQNEEEAAFARLFQDDERLSEAQRSKLKGALDVYERTAR